VDTVALAKRPVSSV
jgi:hypothetical protein